MSVTAEMTLRHLPFATDGAEAADNAQLKKIKITFEQFQKVTRALVQHLRQFEDGQPDGKYLILMNSPASFFFY